MAFIPISMEKFIPLHLSSNPTYTRADVESRLEAALAAHKAGTRCDCGNPIWVIGSAEAGNACFTCITGDAFPTDDYELEEALSSQRPERRRRR